MGTARTQLRALGIVSALGAGCGAHHAAFSSGSQRGMRPGTSPSSGRPTFLGMVDGELPRLPESLHHLNSRNAQLLSAALQQIRSDVDQVIDKFGAERVGVVLGSSTSGIAEGEKAIAALSRGESFPDSYRYTQQEMGAVSSVAAALCGARGPAYTISTACSSSAKVFQSGRALIELGVCDAVIVGGADSMCGMTLEGFSALDLLAPSLTNPFSKNRAGINIGEAAALFLLTREAAGIQLLGVGEASDAHHVSAPDPAGLGAIRAMRSALNDAVLAPADVSYINLHGTGTPANDAMEAKAVRTVFGSSVPACSSTKPLTGHTLGASGAVEAAVCFLALDEFIRTGAMPLPVHRFDGEYDPEIDELPLVQSESVILPLKKSICVSNSFGFGGSNCTLVFGAER